MLWLFHALYMIEQVEKDMLLRKIAVSAREGGGALLEINDMHAGLRNVLCDLCMGDVEETVEAA